MKLMGYGGNGQEWDNEYRLLCVKHDRDPKLGISQEVFIRLVDVSGASLYCSDTVLEGMMEKMFLDLFPVEPNRLNEARASPLHDARGFYFLSNPTD